MTAGWTLTDEPAQLLTVPFQGAIDSKGDKFLAQPALAPFAPGPRLPSRQRHVLQHRIGPSRPLVDLSFHFDMEIAGQRHHIMFVASFQASQKGAISPIVGIGAYYLNVMCDFF